MSYTMCLWKKETFGYRRSCIEIKNADRLIISSKLISKV